MTYTEVDKVSLVPNKIVMVSISKRQKYNSRNVAQIYICDESVKQNTNRNKLISYMSPVCRGEL